MFFVSHNSLLLVGEPEKLGDIAETSALTSQCFKALAEERFLHWLESTQISFLGFKLFFIDFPARIALAQNF